MADFNDAAAAIDRLAQRLPIAAGELKQDVAKVILRDLTQVTPADVGVAISNWQASVDAPVIETVPAFRPSPRGRMVSGKWTHAVDPGLTMQANAPAAMDVGNIIIESALPGQPIFITNVLPYIERLNQGTSDQAPAGFVERAGVLARSFLERARLKL